MTYFKIVSGENPTTYNETNPEFIIENHSKLQFNRETSFDGRPGYYLHVVSGEKTNHFHLNPYTGQVNYQVGPNAWYGLEFHEITQTPEYKNGIFYYSTPEGRKGFPCDNMGLPLPIDVESLLQKEEAAGFREKSDHEILAPPPLAQRIVKKLLTLKNCTLILGILSGIVGTPLLISAGLQALPQLFLYVGGGIDLFALIFLMVAGVKHCCDRRIKQKYPQV
jgi:hypothetical protein